MLTQDSSTICLVAHRRTVVEVISGAVVAAISGGTKQAIGSSQVKSAESLVLPTRFLVRPCTKTLPAIRQVTANGISNYGHRMMMPARLYHCWGESAERFIDHTLLSVPTPRVSLALQYSKNVFYLDLLLIADDPSDCATTHACGC